MKNENDFKYADFGIRLAAILIDSIIFTIVFMILLFVIITPLAALIDSNNEKAIAGAAIGGFFLYLIGLPILIFSYQAGFSSSKYQGTPGKILLKLKIVNLEGNRISFAQGLGRSVSRIPSGFLLIGYFLALTNDKCQTLHDMLAGTLVIKQDDAL